MDLVLEGKVHLKDVKISIAGLQEDQYHGVKGVFCKLDWELHKSNPSACKYYSLPLSFNSKSLHLIISYFQIQCFEIW